MNQRRYSSKIGNVSPLQISTSDNINANTVLLLLFSFFTYYNIIAFNATEKDVECTVGIPKMKVTKPLFGGAKVENGTLTCEILERFVFSTFTLR